MAAFKNYGTHLQEEDTAETQFLSSGLLSSQAESESTSLTLHAGSHRRETDAQEYHHDHRNDDAQRRNDYQPILRFPTVTDLFRQHTTHFKNCGDVLGHIFGFLPDSKVVQMRRVNRFWQEIADDTGAPYRMAKGLRDGVEEHNAEIRDHYGKWVTIRKQYLLFTIIFCLLPILIVPFICVPTTLDAVSVASYVVFAVLAFSVCVPTVALMAFLLRRDRRQSIRIGFMLEVLCCITLIGILGSGTAAKVSEWRYGVILNQMPVAVAECPLSWPTTYPSFVKFLNASAWTNVCSDHSVAGIKINLYEYIGERLPCEDGIPRECLAIAVDFDNLQTYSNEVVFQTVNNHMWFSTATDSRFSISNWLNGIWWIQYNMPFVSASKGFVDLHRSEMTLVALLSGYIGSALFLIAVASGIFVSAWIELERRQLRLPSFACPTEQRREGLNLRRKSSLLTDPLAFRSEVNSKVAKVLCERNTRTRMKKPLGEKAALV